MFLKLFLVCKIPSISYFCQALSVEERGGEREQPKKGKENQRKHKKQNKLRKEKGKKKQMVLGTPTRALAAHTRIYPTPLKLPRHLPGRVVVVGPTKYPNVGYL